MRSSPLAFGALSLLCVALLLSSVACSDDGRPGVAVNTSSGANTSGGNPCADPAEGCPCADEAAEAACGKVLEDINGYVTCSMGTTVCEGGRWAACVGDQVVTRRVGGGLQIMGLGDAGPCVNACSPSCATFVDTPAGLDAGREAGLRITDAGLQLEPGQQATSSCTSLQIAPTTAPAKDVTITGPGPWTVQFTATLLPLGCFAGTFNPLWSVDKFDVAEISSTGLLNVVTPVAGPIQVRAFGGNLASNIVTTNVTVRRTSVSVQAPPPVGVTAATFPNPTGAEPVDALTFLYPYANTMFPLALPSPLLQWSATTLANGATDAVKVTLRYPATGTPIFEASEIRAESTTFPVPLRAARPRAVIPQADWAAFEQTVLRNMPTLGDTGEFVVQRRIGGTLRRVQELPVRFAPTALKGRIYYNTYGTALVQNYAGARQQTGGAFPGGMFGAATLQVRLGDSAPTVVAGTASACRVCHSASSDGQLLITAHSDYNTHKYLLPGAGPLGAAYSGSTFVFPGIHPNKTRVYNGASQHAGGAKSLLYDDSATAISGGTQPSNLQAGYPAFSHETSGTGQVAFTFRGGSPSPLPNPSSGPVTGDGRTLSMMTFDGNRTFSNFRNLYTPPASNTVWWPAFLPPGQNGIVFHLERRYNGRDPGGTRSDCEQTNGCGGPSYNPSGNRGTTAELWWVNTTGTPNARRLDIMNGYNPGGATGYLPTGPDRHGGVGSDPTYFEQVYNYEPTVLPVMRGGYSWVTFTARRMYGNVATIDPYASDPRFYDNSIDPTPKKLWISAMSANPAAGTDPSFPAFYVPGQELISGNMRGYFALDACRNPGPKVPANECDTDLDCCAGSACALDRPISSPPKRYCVSTSAAVCKADGAACTTDAECCNFATGVRCASGVCALPPPIFSNASFDREFTASCGFGLRPRWGLYQWQSIIPAGTSISFQAQTRANSSAAWGPFVAIGSATATTSTWTSGAQTVAQALAASGQATDLAQVRVRANLMVGSPPTATPVLTQWRLTYDCVGAE